MRTSTSMTRRTNRPLYLSTKGFTLLEILIALGLMSLVFSFALNYNFSSRQLLEAEVKKIERAIRYSGDETSLRNKIIRIKFDLEKTPQSFTIEYGPDDNFVLPAKKYPEKDSLTETKLKKLSKDLKKIDKKFIPLSDISAENLVIDEALKIIGIGIIEDQKIVYDFYPSIHFYPSGERDGVVIFVASEQEIIGIVVSPFKNDIQNIYRELVYNEYNEIEEVQYETMMSIFQDYLK